MSGEAVKLRVLRHAGALGGAGVIGVVGLVAANWAGERSAVAAPAEPARAVAAVPGAKGLQNDVFRDGEAGFVLTRFAYALGPDAKDSGGCPAGLSGGMDKLVQQYRQTAEGQQKEGETRDRYDMRVRTAVSTAPNGQNICLHPEAASPDPNWRMVTGRDQVADGIDLDGPGGGGRTAGTCAHPEFRGADGARGVDNQFFRTVGCLTGFQSTGQGNGFDTEMYTGSWGIVMTLRHVDDLRNDPDVEIGIHANADPIELSAERKALPFATYAIDRNPRYRATTRGRIVDGVLTSDPVEVRFHHVVNSMNSDRVLRGARLRVTFTSDGGVDGYLAGYAPVDDMYNLQFGSRDSKTAKGDLAPERLRVVTSVGRAGALGYSCNGAYHAMLAAADGDRDPATGRCTSISTQYRIHAIPAFVVDAQTKSANAPLALK